MNETLVTVVGNVATAPVFREFGTGRVIRFRLAVTSRYWDRTGGAWADGHTNFFTVCAWRGLAENAMASLSVGEPVVVQGRLKVRQEDRGDGKQWFAAEIDASAIGHDLSRGTSTFHRTRTAVQRGGAADGAGEPAAVRSRTADPWDGGTVAGGVPAAVDGVPVGGGLDPLAV
ncbi:single-stranded DNA-binding protein [Streptomyces sp. NPDC002454]